MKFRGAVIKNDLNAIAGMTQFPLEVWEARDNDEKEMVARVDFDRRFPELLNIDLGDQYQQPVLTPKPSSMKALVDATTRLPPSYCNAAGDQFRVGEWVFKSTSNGWRFAQAFVPDI
jgi:hypothetical protein